MRLGYEGLSALARNFFRQDPLSGHLFVFLNKQKNRVKILFWDRGGFCLFCKRLEKGNFTLPLHGKPTQSDLEVDRVELSMLLDGITVKELKRAKRYFPT